MSTNREENLLDQIDDLRSDIYKLEASHHAFEQHAIEMLSKELCYSDYLNVTAEYYQDSREEWDKNWDWSTTADDVEWKRNCIIEARKILKLP